MQSPSSFWNGAAPECKIGHECGSLSLQVLDSKFGLCPLDWTMRIPMKGPVRLSVN